MEYSGSVNPMAVTMNSDKNITAHFKESTAAIQDLADSGNIIVYPNPAKGENITVQIPDVEGMVNIELTDINKRLVIGINEQVYSHRVVQLPVNNLINGIYIISISSGDFNRTQKLIIG